VPYSGLPRVASLAHTGDLPQPFPPTWVCEGEVQQFERPVEGAAREPWIALSPTNHSTHFASYIGQLLYE
jgi:hypothetical protein